MLVNTQNSAAYQTFLGKEMAARYTYFNKVRLAFGHWNAEYYAMLCLSDHKTMAFKDQSTISKATFIEIGVYS